VVPLHRQLDEVIEKSSGNAAIDGGEVTLWVNNCRDTITLARPL
jgi:hypothetical protein